MKIDSLHERKTKLIDESHKDVFICHEAQQEGVLKGYEDFNKCPYCKASL